MNPFASIRLKVQHADRYDFKTTYGEASNEVVLKLKGIVLGLLPVDVGAARKTSHAVGQATKTAGNITGPSRIGELLYSFNNFSSGYVVVHYYSSVF
ncbi:hypothetical protein V6N12_058149 [Hibiscus sabdariffa]|uniref:DUF7903 domain-containing protein n=1 Tax=Hibiscus sabdariffa TaxID=183260 RepID=A0ABR1ZPL7_9ROSI